MTVVDLALIVVAVAFLLALGRVAFGPTIADRAVAADVCFFCTVSALALLAIDLDVPLFVDLVLVAMLLGFVATLSLARLLGRDE
jgi:multicomponent Na+:H+ antiporter subunit F